MTIFTNKTEHCPHVGIFYIEDGGVYKTMEHIHDPDDMPDKSIGNCNADIDWLDSLPGDEREEYDRVFGNYCRESKEFRCQPLIKIEINNGVVAAKFKTDIHKHISERYELPKNKKVKVSITVTDPITEKAIDYDRSLNYKIQVLSDGIPEELDRGEVIVTDGLGSFEFDAPKTKKNVFLKVKPPTKAYTTDGTWLDYPNKFVCLLSFK